MVLEKVQAAELIFIGHLTLDDTVLPNGKTHFDSLGGAALYSASGAKLWGKQVGIVSRTGSDYNPSYLQELNDFGINTIGIEGHDLPNIHIWALYDRQGNRYFIPQAGTGNYFDLAPQAHEIPTEYIESAKGYHIAPLPLPVQEKMVETLAATGRIITIDPHHEWLDRQYFHRWSRLLRNIDVFLPSEDEFTAFWNINKQEHPDQYKDYIIETTKLGAKIVVLKLGEKGVIIYNSEEEQFYRVPSIAVNVIDVTGGGDAFCGGFLSGYVKTNDTMTAALYGTVSSSFVIEDFGPMHMFALDRSQIQTRLKLLEEKIKSLI
jgi:cytidine kinase